jgi:hypothetical protein
MQVATGMTLGRPQHDEDHGLEEGHSGVFERAFATLNERQVIGTMFGFLSNDSESRFHKTWPSTGYQQPCRAPTLLITSHWHNVRVLIQELDAPCG